MRDPAEQLQLVNNSVYKLTNFITMNHRETLDESKLFTLSEVMFQKQVWNSNPHFSEQIDLLKDVSEI